MSLQTRLEQAKKDKDINIKTADKEIDRIKAQIEAEKKPKLDYDKTIITKSGEPLILVSNCDLKSYEIKGYDWLRLRDGRFNSSCLYKTKQEAVNWYGEENCWNEDFGDLKAKV